MAIHKTRPRAEEEDVGCCCLFGSQPKVSLCSAESADGTRHHQWERPVSSAGGKLGVSALGAVDAHSAYGGGQTLVLYCKKCGAMKSSKSAHAGGVLYSSELGSVTSGLKRVGLFCFPIKHRRDTNHPVYVGGGQVSDWEESQVLAPIVSYPRLCSDGAFQKAHDIWENWAAGASHADDSFSLGL